jgi:hypothetical protein
MRINQVIYLPDPLWVEATLEDNAFRSCKRRHGDNVERMPPAVPVIPLRMTRENPEAQGR